MYMHCVLSPRSRCFVKHIWHVPPAVGLILQLLCSPTGSQNLWQKIKQNLTTEGTKHSVICIVGIVAHNFFATLQGAITCHWRLRNHWNQVQLHDLKQVEYFAGSKAVDALVKDSPWCAEKVKDGADHKFDCRERAIEFMDLMLRHKMFHRAKKIPVHSEKKKTKWVILYVWQPSNSLHEIP